MAAVSGGRRRRSRHPTSAGSPRCSARVRRDGVGFRRQCRTAPNRRPPTTRTRLSRPGGRKRRGGGDGSGAAKCRPTVYRRHHAWRDHGVRSDPHGTRALTGPEASPHVGLSTSEGERRYRGDCTGNAPSDQALSERGSGSNAAPGSGQMTGGTPPQSSASAFECAAGRAIREPTVGWPRTRLA